LARGDDPEVVIQRIADYRSDDKGDPNLCRVWGYAEGER
jgi:hypothetical protein